MLLYNNVAELRQKLDHGHHAFAGKVVPVATSGIAAHCFAGQETTANSECVRALLDF
jgi:hypothetical protein